MSAGFAYLRGGVEGAVGGPTAHAALVARQMGKPCIVGCAGLSVDAGSRRADLCGSPINEGDWLSIAAEHGTISPHGGAVAVERPEAEIAEIERWRAQSVEHLLANELHPS